MLIATALQNVLDSIGTVLGEAIEWVGTVISAFFGTAASGSTAGMFADLLPFLCIGLGVGILGLGVKYVRSFVKLG